MRDKRGKEMVRRQTSGLGRIMRKEKSVSVQRDSAVRQITRDLSTKT